MGTWDIVERTGPLSYVVQVAGKLWKHHIDHIREVEDTPSPGEAVEELTKRQDLNMPQFQEPEEPTSREETIEEPATQPPEPKTGNDLLDEGAAAVSTGGSTLSTSLTEPPPSNSAHQYPLRDQDKHCHSTEGASH